MALLELTTEFCGNRKIALPLLYLFQAELKRNELAIKL